MVLEEVRTKKPRCQEPKKEYKKTRAKKRIQKTNLNVSEFRRPFEGLYFLVLYSFFDSLFSLAFILWFLVSWLLGSSIETIVITSG